MPLSTELIKWKNKNVTDEESDDSFDSGRWKREALGQSTRNNKRSDDIRKKKKRKNDMGPSSPSSSSDSISSSAEQNCVDVINVSSRCEQIIEDPTDSDVLYGRNYAQPGNKLFHELVNKRKRAYKMTRSNVEKNTIVSSIISEIRALDPPGRFLIRDAKTGFWVDGGDEKARYKTSNALRSNAQSIRAEIEEEDVDSSYFTEKEKKLYGCGYYVREDIDDVNQLFKENRIDASSRYVALKGHMLEIPASYCGDIDEEFWKKEGFEESLRKLPKSAVAKKVVMFGKVMATWNEKVAVALVSQMSAPEIVEVSKEDAMRFVLLMNEKKIRASKQKKKVADIPDGVVVEKDRDISDGYVESDNISSCSSSEESELGSATDEENDDNAAIGGITEYGAKWKKLHSVTKAEYEWEYVEKVKETSYNREKDSSAFHLVKEGEWETITNGKIFMKQIPEGEEEFRLWARATNHNLIMKKLPKTDSKEMKRFCGYIYAVTQGYKVGGIDGQFSEVSNGLYPAPNLGRHGIKNDRWKELWDNWSFSEIPTGKRVKKMDPNWEIDALIERFNQHYKKNFHHGYKVIVDELLAWSFAQNQAEGVKNLGKKSKYAGLEMKTLAASDVRVTTALEHVRNDSKNCEYSREWGKAAAVVLRLSDTAGIIGSRRIVTAGPNFGNMHLGLGLREHGLHGLMKIKEGCSGYPTDQLKAVLDDKPRGSWATAQMTHKNEKYIACAWKDKSAKFEGKKRRDFLTYFLGTDCTTTLKGTPSKRKRHDLKTGKEVAPEEVEQPSISSEYHCGIPETNISINQHGDMLLEEAISLSRGIACTIVGTWMANAHGMAMKWSNFRNKEDTSVGAFLRDVVMTELFDKDADPSLSAHAGSTVAENTTADVTATSYPSIKMDQIFHTMLSFKDIGANRQQRCVMCYQEGRNTCTSYYCGLCSRTASRENMRKPSKHAYCCHPERQCFARHVCDAFQRLLKGDDGLDSKKISADVAGQTHSPQLQTSGRKRRHQATAAQSKTNRKRPAAPTNKKNAIHTFKTTTTTTILTDDGEQIKEDISAKSNSSKYNSNSHSTNSNERAEKGIEDAAKKDSKREQEDTSVGEEGISKTGDSQSHKTHEQIKKDGEEASQENSQCTEDTKSVQNIFPVAV